MVFQTFILKFLVTLTCHSTYISYFLTKKIFKKKSDEARRGEEVNLASPAKIPTSPRLASPREDLAKINLAWNTTLHFIVHK